MERQFFSGNTLEQAILAAARHHGLDPDRVAYTPRDKKHGFVNIRRRVVIEVDPAAPELAESAQAEQGEALFVQEPTHEPGLHPETPAPETQRPAARERHHGETRETYDRSGRTSWRGEASSWVLSGQKAEEIEALEEAIGELSNLVGIGLAPSIRRQDGGFEIELTGPESGLLRDDRGSGLGAVEHLLPRMVRGLSGRGVPCRVDSEGFRAAHEEQVVELARRAAEDVSRVREEKRLEPMNPADRRLVHLALVDDPTVRTQSEGEGFLKRVRIVPL